MENPKEIDSSSSGDNDVNTCDLSISCSHPENESQTEKQSNNAEEFFEIKADIPEQSNDHEVKADEISESKNDVKDNTLYPEVTKEELSKVQHLRPYTEKQLAALYKNTELEVLDTFTSQFIEAELKGLSIKRHPLYELLTNYLQARDKITGNTLELNQTLQEYNEQRSHIWTIENCSISGRAQCSDGCTLTTSQVYSKAIFHRSVFETVNRLLKNIRNFIHQNHVLYSYLAENLRLQVTFYIFRC